MPSGLLFAAASPTTITTPSGYYTFFVGDGTGGTTVGTLYKKDSAGTLTAVVPAAYTDEQAQDAVAAALVAGSNASTNSNRFTYDDPGNAIKGEYFDPFLGRVTAASKSYARSDNGGWYERLNGGAAMTDTLPTLTAADNGFTVGIHNKGTTIAETITFTGAGGEVIGDVATTYVLNYACRQTFIWTGTKWLFGAGNANLPKSPTPAPAAGDFATFTDTSGRQLASQTLAATKTALGLTGTNSGDQLAFAVVTGNTGTASADTTADTIAITGTAPVVTTATDTPDGLVISMPAATTTTAGYMSAADKKVISSFALGIVNIIDYGGDNTGATQITTALNNAIAAFGGAGGVVMFPAGTYLENSAPYVVSANNIRLWAPAGPNATGFKTSNVSGDQLRLSGYGCIIDGFNIQGPGSGTTSNKTSGIGLDIQSTEGRADYCSFSFQYDACRVGGALVDVCDLWVRYFKNNGIIVDHNSDHRMTKISMVNNAATLPANAGIDVRVTASLVMDALNIIASNYALNISPASGVTVPSVKVTNAFFDTSAIGVRFAGAGSVLRSEFTQCWFSSMTQYGVLMAPPGPGSVDGITWMNCDMYNNVAGTTVGVAVTTANVGKWKMVGCSIAGWTTGISLVGGTNHYPTILSNTIGAVSAFGVNTTGITVTAGTYKGLVMIGNDCNDNTTVLSLGAVTVTNWANYRVLDNPGINPRGTVTQPAVPASTVAATNTTGFRVTVYLKAGTLTVVTVNGVITGQAATPGASLTLPITLDPGGTVAVTYSVAPTWVWIAN